MNARFRVWVVVVACALVSAVAIGCGDDSDDDAGGKTDSSPASGSASAPSGKIVVSWDAAPENWGPGTDNIEGFLRIPYETLIQRTAEDANEFEPMLATEWELTDESMTLKLKEDVKFHDGTPFNAAAVKANLEYVKKEAGPFSGYLSAIETIKVVDDYNVELQLSEPDPALEIALGSRAGLMASPAALKDGSIEKAPVGTGPWQYSEDEGVAGTRWVFNYFPDYYDASQANVKTIELVATSDAAARFAGIRTGEIDVGEHDPATLKQAEDAGLGTSNPPGTHIGLIMVDRGPGGKLEDVETRRAVCSGIDREQFAKVGGATTRTMQTQRFPEGNYGHNPEIDGWPLDAERAAKAKGLKINVGLFDAVTLEGEALAGQLEKHGIDLNVEIVPASEYFAKWYSDWDVGLGDNTEFHPYSWYKTWFAAEAPNNPSGVESAELKAAADEAIAAGSSPEAEELWATVMKVIHDEALICHHYDFNNSVAWNKDRVDNVVTFPYQAAFIDYRKVTLVK